MYLLFRFIVRLLTWFNVKVTADCIYFVLNRFHTLSYRACICNATCHSVGNLSKLLSMMGSVAPVGFLKYSMLLVFLALPHYYHHYYYYHFYCSVQYSVSSILSGTTNSSNTEYFKLTTHALMKLINVLVKHIMPTFICDVCMSLCQYSSYF